MALKRFHDSFLGVDVHNLAFLFTLFAHANTCYALLTIFSYDCVLKTSTALLYFFFFFLSFRSNVRIKHAKSTRLCASNRILR